MAVKVEWEIGDFELSADVSNGGASSHFGLINGILNGYVAYISEAKDPNFFTAKKEDCSLVELINWVEEELKFRNSHG